VRNSIYPIEEPAAINPLCMRVDLVWCVQTLRDELGLGGVQALGEVLGLGGVLGSRDWEDIPAAAPSGAAGY
jgi:hypothetical protein